MLIFKLKSGAERRGAMDWMELFGHTTTVRHESQDEPLVVARGRGSAFRRAVATGPRNVINLKGSVLEGQARDLGAPADVSIEVDPQPNANGRHPVSGHFEYIRRDGRRRIPTRMDFSGETESLEGETIVLDVNAAMPAGRASLDVGEAAAEGADSFEIIIDRSSPEEGEVGVDDVIDDYVGGLREFEQDLKASPVSELVYLPTAGVFGEAILGLSNASEYVDPRRFYNWQDSPIPNAAPQIVALDMNQHRAGEVADDLEPTVPESTLEQQAPIAYPLPTSLTEAFQALQNGAMFRDMSKADQFATVLGNLSEMANQTAQLAGKLSGEAAKNGLDAAVSLGNRVASMTESALKSNAAPPPLTPTEKAGALANLDEISEDPAPQQPVSDNDEAKGDAMGTPISRNGTGQNKDEPSDSPTSEDEELLSKVLAPLPGPDDGRRLVAQIFFKTRQPDADTVQAQLAALDTEDRLVLDRLRDRDWPHLNDSTWEVHGFADARGDRTGEDPTLNQTLSRRRVQSVAGYLLDLHGGGAEFGEEAKWMIKAYGDRFSDPSDRSGFPYDRRVDIFVTVGEVTGSSILPFTDEEVDHRVRSRLATLAQNAQRSISLDDAALHAENEIMLYAKAKELQELLLGGATLSDIGGEPGLDDLRFLLMNQAGGADNLQSLMGLIRRTGRPRSNSDFTTATGQLLWIVRDQVSKVNDPFYRLLYLDPLEGKDPNDPPFFNASPEPEDYEDYPPSFDDLSDEKQQAVIDAGLRSDYVSGVDHRDQMRPHLDKRQRLVDEAKEKLDPFPRLRQKIENRPSNEWLR
jgi:outer membrane protein OmpA-like peptidoglycan-associated protein